MLNIESGGWRMYGEWLIIVNTIFNSVIISFVSNILSMPVTKKRIILISFISSCIAIFLYPSWVGIIGSFLVVVTVFKGQRHFWKGTIIIWVTAFFIGGMLSFLQLYVVLTTKSAIAITITAISLYLLIRLYQHIKQSNAESKLVRQIFLQLFDKNVMLNGYIDSGNNCSEVFSGKPVHFLRFASVEQILPLEFKKALQLWDENNFDNLSMFSPELRKKIRIVPFQTISTKQMIPVFPCEFQIGQSELTYHHYIAFTNNHSTFPQKCELLLHVSIFDEK